MHLKQRNIDNLIGLWKKYGSQKQQLGDGLALHANSHWPHRHWFEETDKIAILANSGEQLDQLAANAIVPIWPELKNYKQLQQLFIDKNWHCSFEQTAMALSLQPNAINGFDKTSSLATKKIHSHDDIKAWVDIGSEAFSYQISTEVIESLRRDAEVELFLAYYQGEPAASGLLYKTGAVVGIHQIAVKPGFQGKGIARKFMHSLLTRCVQWQTQDVVLQASAMGRRLYESLGFRPLFKIQCYQRLAG